MRLLTQVYSTTDQMQNNRWITYFHLTMCEKVSILCILLPYHSHCVQFGQVMVGVPDLGPHALQPLEQFLS